MRIYTDNTKMFIFLLLLSSCMGAPGDWWPLDNFDEIRDAMDAITAENCDLVNTNELRLPLQTFPDPPYLKDIKAGTIKEYREKLIVHHNLALGRAMTYSFIYAKQNSSEAYYNLPRMLYYYFAASADISDVTGITGSGLFLDNNCTYPLWIPNLQFNKTILFGTRAHQVDGSRICVDSIRKCIDVADSTFVTDYAAGPGSNYTKSEYKHNPWYFIYMPDEYPGLDPVLKQSQHVEIRYMNSTQNSIFFGPAIDEYQDSIFEPVSWTAPYFDCGRTNKWIVTAVSPFVEYLPRYLQWWHLRRHVFVGVSTEDAMFENVDIDQCPGTANNYFQGTAKCKDTTACESLTGFGFNRGGYQCVCREGLVYPPEQDGPFIGIDIEAASEEEYENGFDCVIGTKEYNTGAKTGQVYPIIDDVRKSRFIPRYNFESQFVNRSPHFDVNKRKWLEKLVRITLSFETDECFAYNSKDIIAHEDVLNDSPIMNLHRNIAARQAKFLSMFLQNVKPNDDRFLNSDSWLEINLNIDHVIGETVGAVLANVHLHSNAIYFDANKFINSNGQTLPLFAPRSQVIARDTHVDTVDLASLVPPYTEKEWFKDLKQRWEHGNDLNSDTQTVEERADIYGEALRMHIHSPMRTYYATVDNGTWIETHLDCEKNEMTAFFAVPFFGLSDEEQIEFFGAVVVETSLEYMDIHQCPKEYHTSDPFSNTALCDYSTSKCVPGHGHGFTKGGYTCICHNGNVIDGIDLEMEYTRKQSGLSNGFSQLLGICDLKN